MVYSLNTVNMFGQRSKFVRKLPIFSSYSALLIDNLYFCS